VQYVLVRGTSRVNTEYKLHSVMNGDFSSDATVNGYGNVKDNLMDKETSYYARNRPKPKKPANKHTVVSRLENIKFMYFQFLLCL